MARDDDVGEIHHSSGALIEFHRIGMRCTYRERESSFLELDRWVKIFLRATPSRDDGSSFSCLYSDGLAACRMTRSKEKFYLVVDFGVSLDDLPTHPFKQFLKIFGEPWLRIRERVVYLVEFGLLDDCLGSWKSAEVRGVIVVGMSDDDVIYVARVPIPPSEDLRPKSVYALI